ncbi:hypothetical protein [Amycolatopsis lurida]|uniref:hypothetical protein n=1 Tax=Amycolatopsis lurida TaxID=31959 RepID=UPI00115FF7F9|nr:hypothetical protein [Amycolatopsis lurida]
MNIAAWWVPLGAAAIALIGVVTGQALSISGENRRQRREIKQRTFEHWRDQRIEAYSNFLQYSYLWSTAAHALLLELYAAVDNGKTLSDAGRLLREQLHEPMRVTGQILVSIELLASDSWRETAKGIRQQMLLEHGIITRMNPNGMMGFDSTDKESLDRVQARLNSLDVKISSLREVSRAELGISKSDDRKA